MGNVPSRHPKAELYPYLGYGCLSPTSPKRTAEKDTIVFQEILQQPLVLVEASVPAAPRKSSRDDKKHRRSSSWASSRSSTSSRRVSFDTAFDAAREAWERVLPTRRKSYHKLYEHERPTIGIEWAEGHRMVDGARGDIRSKRSRDGVIFERF